jgi:cyanate lyase
VIRTDPLLYRFHEIASTRSLPRDPAGLWPAAQGCDPAEIRRRFHVGNFTLTVAKVEDPKGDRVLVTMNGTFLPYRKW